MSRSLKAVAGAAALLCFGLAHAQSNVNIYGLMDAAVGSFQMAGADSTSKVQSGNMTTSFIGFNGSEDVGNGLKVTFAIEHFLQADAGTAGRFVGDKFWARNAYVGLATNYGEYQFGRTTTTMFVSTLMFNAIGDSFAFSPSILQVLTPQTDNRPTGARMLSWYGDTGWSNSVLFKSKSWNGLSFNVQANLGEGASATSYGKNLASSVLYMNGPLAATVSYSKVKNDAFGAPAGFEDQETKQVGAWYDFGVVKLFGQYTAVDTTATVDTGTDIWGLGASIPLAGGKVLAQYGHAKEDGNTVEKTNKTLTLGYDYNLSKRTEVYAIYMQDKVTGYDTGDTYAVGIRHKF
ncbi:porin [Rubrivivax gelatinosus]|nr:porin [Rubrivivax gelatinosus]